MVTTVTNPAGIAATYLALSPGHQGALGDALLQSGIPTLLVVGGLDAKYAAMARELVAGGPMACAPTGAPIRWVEIEGAGHNVHLEDPDAYAAALHSFWEGLP